MSAKACERAYQRGIAGRFQLRTEAGRLLASAEHIEAIETDAAPTRGYSTRYLWIRHGAGRWLTRAMVCQ